MKKETWMEWMKEKKETWNKYEEEHEWNKSNMINLTFFFFIEITFSKLVIKNMALRAEIKQNKNFLANLWAIPKTTEEKEAEPKPLDPK